MVATVAATAARKKGAVTWKIGNIVYQFSGSFANYRDVAATLGMTVYDDSSKIVLDNNDSLVRRTKAGHVVGGSAIVATAEVKTGTRVSKRDILIPANKLEDVFVNNSLAGKAYGKGTISTVRGKTQVVVSV